MGINLNQPVFGCWKIVREIGAGSFGAVYEIERIETVPFSGQQAKQKAALKIISIPKDKKEVVQLRSSGMDAKSITAYYQDYAQKIYREIEMMVPLSGESNIVSYQDHQIIPHEDGVGYDILIRMELLTPLIEYTSQYRMNQSDVLTMGVELCRGLERCEALHIIHRDIKPENIFVSNLGNFKLGDFGIARTAGGTTYGTVAGTYSYMAPEVYKNQGYNATVDLYSLGIVLYQYLNNGRLPFFPEAPEPIRFGDNERANNQRLQGQPLPAPKGASAGVANVILKACAYESKDRYQTAAELRAALIAAAQSKQEMKTAYVPTAMEEFPETVCLWKSRHGIRNESHRKKRKQPEAGSSSAASAENTTENAVEYAFEYDSNGNKTKETWYNADGSIWYIHEYDSNGNKKKATLYKNDGSINCWLEYEYDSNGNQTKKTKYNADGSIVS